MYKVPWCIAEIGPQRTLTLELTATGEFVGVVQDRAVVTWLARGVQCTAQSRIRAKLGPTHHHTTHFILFLVYKITKQKSEGACYDAVVCLLAS